MEKHTPLTPLVDELVAVKPQSNMRVLEHDHHHSQDNDNNHHHEHAGSIQRLKTAEGHLRGIQRMLEQDAYCIDVIRQIQAVQAALNKISASILDQHLNTCVITAVRGEDPQDRERVLKEIAEVFETKAKI